MRPLLRARRAVRPVTGAAPGRGGYRAVLAAGEFRAVLLAHLLSTLGMVVGEVALSVLVYRLTGSPVLSALTFALGLLPYALGGIVAASAADRFPARRVLVACDLLCAGCAAGMTLAGTPMGVLLALQSVIAVTAPVFGGTRAAALTDILGDGDPFVLGRSLIRLVAQGAQLAGFAAGGLVLAALSPHAVLALTAAAFAGSAVIIQTGTRSRPARHPAGGPALVASSVTDARRLCGDRNIRSLLLLAWTPPAFVVVSEALMTPYAARIGAGPAGLGLLLCGMPAGAVTSEALVGWLLGPRGRQRLCRPVATAAMLPSVGYLLHPALGWALACQVGTGCGITYSLGLDQWFTALVPGVLRGQALTLMAAGLMTVQGLGMALGGVAAGLFPVHDVVACAGILGVVCVSATVWQSRTAVAAARAAGADRGPGNPPALRRRRRARGPAR